jgi:hypothetical protein
MINNKKARIALSQIFILIFGIIAFSWGIGEVNANSRGLAGEDTELGPGDYSQKGPKGLFESAAFNSTKNIAESAFYAASIYYGTKMLGDFFLDDYQSNALASSIAGGFFAGKGIYSLIGKGGLFGKSFYNAAGEPVKKWLFTAEGWSLATGVVVGAIIFFSMYKDEKTKVITYTCNVWEPPQGGENCEKCNSQGIFPCSEYQCRSLGAGCELINKGTEEEKCIWVNEKDVEYPIIKPWLNALTNGYKYNPDNSISPPDRGVIIEPMRVKGCVEAFTPLSFGITTNEPSQCKVSYERKNNFDDMEFYFGGSSLYKYNHSLIMSLPGADSLNSENLTIHNNGNYELYVRCKDRNGNFNIANFVFKYCVEKGPDTTPPLIVTTDLLNNMPIAFNQSSVDIKVYTNEPANCKWSHLDRTYKDMENIMSCSQSVFDLNSQLLYECETTLNGIKNMKKNIFYFRCEDKPLASEEDRNVNKESYKFTIIGTQPLVLNSVGPKGLIKDSTDLVKVELTAETSAGYNQGEAICYYNDKNDSNYIEFYETHSYQHKQELWLSEGNYEYWIKCVDLGGNTIKEKINFRVESDNSFPLIVRAFKEDNYLKIITNEKAECFYGSQNCNYPIDEGIKMIITGDEKVEHYSEWNSNINYYIKCKDSYGNYPNPDQCNMIIRAVDRGD